MKAYEAFRSFFNSSELKKLYISKVGIRPTVGLDKTTKTKFEQRLDENISVILRKVASRNYRFTNYRQLLFSKGKSKLPREICIPTLRDKLTLAALSKVLDEAYGDACNTPQPQKVIDGVIAGIEHGEFDAFIKVDIENFYGSVPHDNLLATLKKRVRKKELVHLLESLLRTPSAPFERRVLGQRTEGIPQGLSVSNKLANIYLEGMDSQICEALECLYFRYVDDILILCDSKDVEYISNYVSNCLAGLDLSRNEGKCLEGLIAESGFTFLGYSFEPNGIISVRKSSKLNIERSLDDIIRSYPKTANMRAWLWRLNLRITGCRITEDEELYERYGWLYYFSRISDIALLSHLDWLIGELCAKHSVPMPSGLKSFKKAFYQMKYKYDETTYIPTFGSNNTTEEKREMLESLFATQNIDALSDDEVDELFNKNIRREAKRLERDVGLIS